MPVSKAERAAVTGFLTFFPRDRSIRRGLVCRHAAVQIFAIVARWSLGVGGFAERDGVRQDVRNAKTETRGYKLNAPARGNGMVSVVTP